MRERDLLVGQEVRAYRRFAVLRQRPAFPCEAPNGLTLEHEREASMVQPRQKSKRKSDPDNRAGANPEGPVQLCQKCGFVSLREAMWQVVPFIADSCRNAPQYRSESQSDNAGFITEKCIFIS
jgi:hypothetical protein